MYSLVDRLSLERLGAKNGIVWAVRGLADPKDPFSWIVGVFCEFEAPRSTPLNPFDHLLPLRYVDRSVDLLSRTKDHVGAAASLHDSCDTRYVYASSHGGLRATP